MAESFIPLPTIDVTSGREVELSEQLIEEDAELRELIYSYGSKSTAETKLTPWERLCKRFKGKKLIAVHNLSEVRIHVAVLPRGTAIFLKKGGLNISVPTGGGASFEREFHQLECNTYPYIILRADGGFDAVPFEEDSFLVAVVDIPNSKKQTLLESRLIMPGLKKVYYTHADALKAIEIADNETTANDMFSILKWNSGFLIFYLWHKIHDTD